MINKYFKNMKKPHLIPKKILLKLFGIYSKMNYSAQKYLEEQEKEFITLGLDRGKGLIKLNNLKDKYSCIEKPMSSEHQILFSSLSVKENILDVLEIGTFDGTNAFLLSKLFDKAKIETMDLNDEDPIFKETYGRKNINKFKDFCDQRNKILNQSNNINFIKKNSMKLIFSDKKYDLIWIDGAHGYPTAAIDITNCLRLVKPNGIIVCDDVWVNTPVNQDGTYNSVATFEVLTALKNAGIINFNLIYKRLDKENNAVKRLRKYIAYTKLN
jgi:predicted O-methyltransferase YrrM